MRKMMGICVWLVAGPWVVAGSAMPITGQVVDSQARPVEGAQVVVCEQHRLGMHAPDVREIGPVVRTDAQGRFALEVEVTRQRDTFIVARKPGLAYGWEWLNSSLNTLSRKHFPLVLEPVCVLAGQVVDAEGKAVAGAEVQATPVNTWGFSGVIDRWAVPGPASWFAVTTDVQGRFRFEQFAADTSAGLRVRTSDGGSVHIFRPHVLESSGYEVGRSDIRLTLPREGTIRGRVVDGQGRPVGGVGLVICSGRDREDVTNLYAARKTWSDPNGAFAFDRVPEGPHEIGMSVSEREFPRWTGGAEKVSVKAGAVAETTIRVGQGSILEVTALDARTRRPVPGARLEATGQRSHRTHSATADARGVARVRIPGDLYAVFVSAPQFSHCQSTLAVADGQTIRRQALLPSLPRVSGRVLDPQARPAVDAVVSVSPGGDLVYTDAQGRFTAARSEQYSTKDAFVTGRDTKTGLAAAVPVSDLSRPIDLRLEPAWTLTGRVADPNGTGIPAARVSLFMGMRDRPGGWGAEGLTDPEGRFEIKATPPMQKSFEYRISASAAGYGQARRVRVLPKGPSGKAVDLGAIRLAPANVSVSGMVVDAGGKPAARIPVFASNSPVDNQPHKMVVTNERGEFTFTRLCPGWIRFQGNLGNSPGGAGYVRTRLPADNVEIVLGKDRTDLPTTTTPNAAPAQLTDLCPYLSCFQTDGMAILLCLVGTGQPSSRQCLTDLARKAQALMDQGVIAVAMQTSRTQSKQDFDLLMANRRVLPWCRAEADFEAQKTAWGITSLPWLILTDKKHVVVGAGFGVDELDRRVEETLRR